MIDRNDLLNWLKNNNAFTDDTCRTLTSGITRRIKNNPDTLQTIRNLVYGNVEMLTREEMRALDIEEPKPLDSEVLKGNEN